MADPVSAAILGGSAIAGGLFGKSGSKSAANAQARSNAQAIAEQQREFDTLLSLTAPQRTIGNQALATLGRIYGYSYDPNSGGNELAQPSYGYDGAYPDIPLGMGGNGIYRKIFDQARGNRIQLPSAPRAPVTINGATGQVEPANYENFFASPDYRFRLDQGTKAVQNSAAAQGGLYSGNALRAISDYGQGTASNEFNNWFARQAALAGIGQAATSQAGNAALTTGANVGNLLVNQGNARASGILDQTSAINNTINQLAKVWADYRTSKPLPDGGWI